MVASVTDSASVNASIGAAMSNGSVLGKDEFLQLLVAQLENQDPLNPNDPTEFTAQLAQFSSLEQLFNMNEGLTNLTQATENNLNLERLSAVGLLGRNVEVSGADFHFSNTPVEFGYTLDSSAAEVKATILDSQGAVVAVLPDAAGTVGPHYFTWDGTGLDGETVAPGDYQLQVERIVGDSATAVETRLKGVVSGVDLDSKGSVLSTSVGEFSLGDVVSVSD